jgi:hypothetical protein
MHSAAWIGPACWLTSPSMTHCHMMAGSTQHGIPRWKQCMTTGHVANHTKPHPTHSCYSRKVRLAELAASQGKSGIGRIIQDLQTSSTSTAIHRTSSRELARAPTSRFKSVQRCSFRLQMGEYDDAGSIGSATATHCNPGCLSDSCTAHQPTPIKHCLAGCDSRCPSPEEQVPWPAFVTCTVVCDAASFQ